MTNKYIRVGVAGGAGYTGGELLRILINHPAVELSFVHSHSNAGNFLHDVHTDLIGETTQKFSAVIESDIDVLFLCVGHGDGRKFLEQHTLPASVKVVDLSQDFRLTPRANIQDRTFVYGLPEMQRDVIKQANNIANPGCFATAIQLALLPLAAQKALNNAIHISATTGSTGAGQAPSATSHFTWRNNNFSSYKVFTHQHLYEIKQNLLSVQPDANTNIRFVPYRGNFTRGILATTYLEVDFSLEEAQSWYETYYASHPFVHVVKKPLDLKTVVNTNKCLIHLALEDGHLIITSAIDNLLKGASGQAVQNMNLLFGLPETTGLQLKSSLF